MVAISSVWSLPDGILSYTIAGINGDINVLLQSNLLWDISVGYVYNKRSLKENHPQTSPDLIYNAKKKRILDCEGIEPTTF